MSSRRLISSRIAVAFVTASIVILVALIFARQNSLSKYRSFEPPLLPTIFVTASPTRPAYCAPIPVESILPEVQSPTPNKSRSTTPEDKRVIITPTFFPLARTIDLAQGLSEADKAQVYVYQCDGLWVLYKIRPDISFRKVITLGAGDIIWSMAPPFSAVGHEPPKDTKATKATLAAATSNSTLVPYPGPNNKVNMTPNSPYPVPNKP